MGPAATAQPSNSRGLHPRPSEQCAPFAPSGGVAESVELLLGSNFSVYAHDRDAPPLTPRDVVIFSLGIHMRPALHRAKLDDFARAYRGRRPEAAPTVVYMQNWAQHFRLLTSEGGYDPEVQHPFRGCLTAVEPLPAASTAAPASGWLAHHVLAHNEELVLASLGGGRGEATAPPVLRTFNALAGAGGAHVGTKQHYSREDCNSSSCSSSSVGVGDCSHWCMPGVIDVFLLPALQAQLEATLGPPPDGEIAPLAEPLAESLWPWALPAALAAAGVVGLVCPVSTRRALEGAAVRVLGAP